MFCLPSQKANIRVRHMPVAYSSLTRCMSEISDDTVIWILSSSQVWTLRNHIAHFLIGCTRGIEHPRPRDGICLCARPLPDMFNHHSHASSPTLRPPPLPLKSPFVSPQILPPTPRGSPTSVRRCHKCMPPQELSIPMSRTCTVARHLKSDLSGTMFAGHAPYCI